MSSLISKGYTPCEYIESSGTQYIDTGFKPNHNTRVVMDVWVLQNNSAVAANELFGARTSTSSKAFAGQYNASNTRLQFFYNNDLSYVTKSSIYSRDLCDANKNSFSFYGASISRSYATFQCDYNLYLLALNNAGVVAYQAIARLYSCQVYDNGTLIRDFKPCRNTSGVYGLFDEVNDVFYTTPSGSFTGSVAETSIKLSQSFRRRLLTSSNNEVGYEKQYFTIEALGSGSISWTKGTYSGDSIHYSKNNGSWVSSTGSSSVTVVSGDKIRFYTVRTDSYQSISFNNNTTRFNVYGNIMSLLHGNNFVGNDTQINYEFTQVFSELFRDSSVVDASNLILPALNVPAHGYASMFLNCTSLTTAPKLPATSLGDYSYINMFSGCTSLTTAPELPANEVGYFSYSSMFEGCTSLAKAPELPAFRVHEYGYDSMFSGCTSLAKAPKLHAIMLANYCCMKMFLDCTNLKTSPELPAVSLSKQCYNSMFKNCTSLTVAPELPAHSLIEYCYDSMFSGCTSLAKAPELPATTLAEGCYWCMFQGCTSLTTAPELPATTLAPYCYNSMFGGCTSLKTAPVLPATTLADYCYFNMFSDCSSLNNITMLATDISAQSCLNAWVYGVSSTGTFVKHPDMNSLPTGVYGIPNGWTVKNNVTISWAVQTGNWTQGSNSSAKDGKQFTSVSPGSDGSTRLRCTFSGVTSITFNCVYNGESNYDYLTVGALDSTCTRDSYGTTLKGTSGTAQDITFSCDSGTHYVEFCYSKDSSVDTQPDCAVVYIKNCS